MTLQWPHVLFIGVLTMACNKNSKPAADANSITTTQSTTAKRNDARPNQTLAVSAEIAKACGITLDDPQDAPKFDLDRSDLSTQDREVLDKVAHCATTAINGPSSHLTVAVALRSALEVARPDLRPSGPNLRVSFRAGVLRAGRVLRRRPR